MKVEDETNSLSEADKAALVQHILVGCYSTPVDRAWLEKIVIEDKGITHYNAHWSAVLDVDPASDTVEDVHALIVLNRGMLPTREDMIDALSHEYGHHVTLSYLLTSRNLANDMTALVQTRLPVDYYRARNILASYQQLDPHYGQGWDACDKEIMAEDYRVLFTTSKAPHRMATKHGPPAKFVRDWIWSLFDPRFHPGVNWPFS